jgi:coenzyme F420-reducing hydrogenase delta subunit
VAEELPVHTENKVDMANEDKKVITLLCERAADLNNLLDANGELNGVSGMHIVKLPCSGMVQPLMIEGAFKNGAAGVIVCGCQLGDCFYREGNKMIRERLLGDRPPGLKKTVDRRRVLALWLSRLQKDKFVAEAKEFVAYVKDLPAPEVAKPAAAPAAKPAAAPAAAKVAAAPAADAAVTEPKAPPAPGKIEPAAGETKGPL